MKLTQALRDDYNRKWNALRVRPAWSAEISDAARRISKGVSRYEGVSRIAASAKLGARIPWYVIGLIHELEASCSFRKHLHNGDLLTSRTRNVPKNRPPGEPPFTFEQSALDALKIDGLLEWADWSIAGIAFKLESFNGWGYRQKGVANPYLYSGSNWYTRGKWVSDGPRGYDPMKVSKQCGCLVILRELARIGKWEVEIK